MPDFKTLDFAHLGQPFLQSKNDPAIDLNTLDYAYLGQPFTGSTIGGSIDPPLEEEFLPWLCIF